MSGAAFLPETGRGTMRSIVEGYARVIPPSQVRMRGACPSPTFGGPPPRFGEELA